MPARYCRYHQKKEEKLIAVFAEANNTGDLSRNLSDAGNVLTKEKKHLKDFFYTRIRTTENVTAATSCSALYRNLQVRYSDIKVFDVLDADALNHATKK